MDVPTDDNLRAVSRLTNRQQWNPGPHCAVQNVPPTVDTIETRDSRLGRAWSELCHDRLQGDRRETSLLTIQLSISRGDKYAGRGQQVPHRQNKRFNARNNMLCGRQVLSLPTTLEAMTRELDDLQTTYSFFTSMKPEDRKGSGAK